MREVISTENAPRALGPYSQAIRANGLVFLSGQVAIDPATGYVVEGGVTQQTERILENLKAVLEAAGSSLESVVKTTVYLKSIGDFSKMNDIYGRYFPSNPPARSTVEVSRLPRDVGVEIDAIAIAPLL
jgi:2-iminobutanoate/2-iminopropanoate deaminase